MPYASLAQERFFHSPGAKKAGITSTQVKEFDSATKGKKLPKYAKQADKKKRALNKLKRGMKGMKK